jgi:hypothetical protein
MLKGDASAGGYIDERNGAFSMERLRGHECWSNEDEKSQQA